MTKSTASSNVQIIIREKKSKRNNCCRRREIIGQTLTQLLVFVTVVLWGERRVARFHIFKFWTPNIHHHYQLSSATKTCVNVDNNLLNVKKQLVVHKNISTKNSTLYLHSIADIVFCTITIRTGYSTSSFVLNAAQLSLLLFFFPQFNCFAFANAYKMAQPA